MSQWAGIWGFLGVVVSLKHLSMMCVGGYSSPLQSLNDLVSRLDVLLRCVLVSVIDGPGSALIYVVGSLL